MFRSAREQRTCIRSPDPRFDVANRECAGTPWSGGSSLSSALSGPRKITVGWVILTVPRRNSVNQAVTDETPSAKAEMMIDRTPSIGHHPRTGGKAVAGLRTTAPFCDLVQVCSHEAQRVFGDPIPEDAVFEDAEFRAGFNPSLSASLSSAILPLQPNSRKEGLRELVNFPSFPIIRTIPGLHEAYAKGVSLRPPVS